MLLQWLLENWPTIASLLFGSTGLVAYILEKRKRKIEEKQLSTDALKSMQEAYDRFSEDSLNKYSEVKEELADLKARLTQVTTELNTEKNKYAILLVEYNKLKSDYYNLRIEFTEYKTLNKKE